jgi:hypothetical protein
LLRRLALLLALAAPAVSQTHVRLDGVQYSAYLLEAPDYNAKIVGQIPRGAVAPLLDGRSNERYVRIQYNGAWWVGRKYCSFIDEGQPQAGGGGSPSLLGVDTTPGGVPAQPGGPPLVQPPAPGDRNGNGLPDFHDMFNKAWQMNQAGVRFDDFDDDMIDNDGDWQPTDDLARRDPTDHDRRLDDTGGDGVIGSGDHEPVTPQLVAGWRYQARRFRGGEGDGQPTPGEPDFDFRDPQEALPDGMHRGWANDGVDNDRDGQVDEPDELTIVCIDFVLDCYKAAGYDLAAAIREDARRNPRRYLALGPGNTADNPFLTRRIQVVKAFLMSNPNFSYRNEPQVSDTTSWRPQPAYVPGEMIFFKNPATGGGHSAIVTEVDPYTGRPTTVMNIHTTAGVITQPLTNTYLYGHVVVGRSRPKAWDGR